MVAYAPALLVLGLAAWLLVWAALSDRRGLIIPNLSSLGVAACYLVYAALADGQDLALHLVAGMAALVVGFAIFAAGAVGGGDVKLLAATALWAGPSGLAGLLLVTGVAGGLVALGIAAQQWLLRRRAVLEGAPGARAISIARAPVPYGIAIAAGGLYVLIREAAGQIL